MEKRRLALKSIFILAGPPLANAGSLWLVRNDSAH
jgi:hypothetical protein